MPVSRARARAARDKLSRRLSSFPWIRHVGVGKNGQHGYAVVLSVDTTNPAVAHLPMHVDGVEVICRATKRARMGARVGADFGDKPVSVIKDGGPIYTSDAGDVMLSPGRYTYSNPVTYYETSWLGQTASPVPGHEAFEEWLDEYSAFIDVNKRDEEPGVEGPYYINYDFTVKEPVVWKAPPLKGLPTWLPPATGDVTEDYWSKGYRAPPVNIIPDSVTLPQVNALIWGMALFGGILLLANSKGRNR